MSYTVALQAKLGPGKTGLTLKGQLRTLAPALVTSGSEFALTETLPGIYSATVTAADGFVGEAYLYTGTYPGTGLDSAAIDPTCSAPASALAVRAELATELGRLDVAVGTRLAAASYTSPPTKEAIGTQVWATDGRDVQTIAGLEPAEDFEAGVQAGVAAELDERGVTSEWSAFLADLPSAAENAATLLDANLPSPAAGKPSKFGQLLAWVNQRFAGPTDKDPSSNTAGTIVVRADDGTVLTTQAYTASDGAESVGVAS